MDNSFPKTLNLAGILIDAWIDYTFRAEDNGIGYWQVGEQSGTDRDVQIVIDGIEGVTLAEEIAVAARRQILPRNFSSRKKFLKALRSTVRKAELAFERATLDSFANESELENHAQHS